MARWLDEVQTCVDTVVNHLLPVHPVFLLEVRIKAGLDVLHDRLPALVVVDEVAKTRGVDDGQAETDAALLNVCGVVTDKLAARSCSRSGWNLPALMLSIATVFGRSTLGSGVGFAG